MSNMDIDFPLVLVCLTFLSGIIWLSDTIFLANKRKLAIAGVDEQFDEKESEPYLQAMEVAGREPVVVDYAKSFFPVLFLVLVLRSFLIEPFQIPSSSMVPTLEVGDFILVNKYAYGIRLPVLGTKVIDVAEPKRGDVMVFFPPHDSRYFIKRVIGLPGDEIHYVNKVLTINGQEMKQELTALLPPSRPTHELIEEDLGTVKHQLRKSISRSDDFTQIVKEGHYFMMGDNRDNSSDSRVWGQVPEANIVGKAFAIWMHWEEMFSVPSFKRLGKIE